MCCVDLPVLVADNGIVWFAVLLSFLNGYGAPHPSTATSGAFALLCTKGAGGTVLWGSGGDQHLVSTHFITRCLHTSFLVP